MGMPETATEAIAAWKAKQPLEAVKMGTPGANQAQQWEMVFEILEASPPGSKFSLQQFEAWCWNSRIGFNNLPPNVAPPQAEFGLRTEARVMAYSILREGFANVIRRRRLTHPASATLVQRP